MMTMPAKAEPRAKSSDEFSTESFPDGTLRIVYNTKQRSVYFWRYLAVGMVFLSISTALAGGSGSYPPEGNGFRWYKVFASLQDTSHWFLTAFMLWAIFLIWTAFCSLVSWKELRVTHGLIEVNYYHLQLRYTRRRYTSGRITVERKERTGSESNDVVGHEWFLFALPNRFKGILAYSLVLGTVTDPEYSRTEAEYARIAELLAQHTGWELTPLPKPAAS